MCDTVDVADTEDGVWMRPSGGRQLSEGVLDGPDGVDH